MNTLHRGKVFRLRQGVVVALLERASQNGWDCMVIGGTNKTYPPGGYDIFVFDNDLKEAEEVEIK
jgi:hypothetical protein